MNEAAPKAAAASAPGWRHEPTPRERLMRLATLARRGLTHWRGAALIFAVGAALAIALALQVRRTYASESTIAVAQAGRPGEGDGPEASARRSARLKDMLGERARFEEAIKRFGLYPTVVESKGMLDAVEAMRPHVGFRARESGRYVVSFDAAEEPGTDARELVRVVTQFLADSLVDEYASGALARLTREADFLGEQLATSDTKLDQATRDVTLFLMAHPEFGVDVKAGGPGPSFGVTASSAARAFPPGPGADSGAAAGRDDAQLASLMREHDRLVAELRTAPPAVGGNAHDNALEQAASAQVDAANKRSNDAQAALATKSTQLTSDHPDMRAARVEVDAAAHQLREARAKLAALLAARVAEAAPTGGDPTAEKRARLTEIDALINQRKSEVRGRKPQASDRPGTPGANAGPGDDSAAVPSPQVELEAEWQRLLRVLVEERSRHEDVSKRSEAARFAVQGSKATANESLSVLEPAYRPTHPSRGGRSQVALIGLAASLLFAALYMAARVVFNDTLRDATDVEALELLPVLGVVPTLRRATRPASPRPGTVPPKGA